MIILAGHLKTSPAEVEAFNAALNALVEPTTKEDGCLNYHFAIDNREQGSILVFERWRDEEALAAHLALPSVIGLLGAWADRVDISGVRKFDAINERGFGD